jgi:uncharacterized protein (TIGR03083 family)
MAPTPTDAPSDDTIFGWIADGRRRVADALEELEPEQLDVASLCGEWTVRECAAHLTAGIDVSMVSFGVEMLKAFGNFDKANSTIARKLGGRGIENTVEVLRAKADHRFTPPGAGPEAPLTDVIVHSQEIFRPLGIELGFDADQLEFVLGFLPTKSFRKLMGGPSLDGVSLHADDCDWTLGSGAEVTGPALSLALVLAGRQWALDDLSGDGLGTLRSNFG